MTSILSAAHVVGLHLEPRDVDQLLMLYVGDQVMWEAFGYRSRHDAETDLRSAIKTYSSATPSEWSNLLALRTKVDDVPDRALRGRLIVGAIRFGMSAADMVPILRERVAN